MRVTASIELSAALAPDSAGLVSVTPVAWSLFDGRITLTDASPNLAGGSATLFRFHTVAGAIVDWEVSAGTSYPGPAAGDQQYLIRTINAAFESDSGQIAQCLTISSPPPACASAAVENGRLADNPGTWTSAEVGAAPLPGTLLLVLAGWPLLGWMRAKRHK
jgi:hypothetical protein